MCSDNLGKTEVERLDGPFRAKLDVGWLQVAVDDAALVRRVQRVRNLSRYRQRFLDRDGAAPDAGRRILALDQLSITSASAPSTASMP